MGPSDFKKEKYYELFINNGSNYPTYWLSSRCIYADTDCANFYIRDVGLGGVGADYVYISSSYENTTNYAFRPCITLKSNVQIDVQNDKDGSTPEKAYIIK